MSKKEFLFYDAYEAFYAMAEQSQAFGSFCRAAFGEDFSQDGFSDIGQINRILPHIPRSGDVHILDIGCGNGKMLGYLQQKTTARIHGFDYSEEAIRTAQALFPVNADFREGVIGEIDYPDESFDVIISMDTMYFARDMSAFTAQIKRWLKPRKGMERMKLSSTFHRNTGTASLPRFAASCKVKVLLILWRYLG